MAFVTSPGATLTLSSSTLSNNKVVIIQSNVLCNWFLARHRVVSTPCKWPSYMTCCLC